MKAFPLKNVVLYAKNHYKRSDNIFEDLKKILEGDDFTPFDSGDVFRIIETKIINFLLDNKNSHHNLQTFLNGLNPYECWKNGYYTKNVTWGKKEDNEKLPEYNYYEAFVRSALSLLSYTSKEDLGWSEWPKPDFTLLPQKEKN